MTRTISVYPLLPGALIEIAQGDITAEPVDAIVNAANDRLQHGGGVAAAIAHKAGPDLERESAAWVRRHGPVTSETPAYTTAGRLPCKYVIHAVGPIWGEGDEDRKLAVAITGSLACAEELGLKTIAFPAISTGIFGFPLERAAQIFFAAFEQYFNDHPASQIERVRLVLYNDSDVPVFTRAADQRFHP